MKTAASLFSLCAFLSTAAPGASADSTELVCRGPARAWEVNVQPQYALVAGEFGLEPAAAKGSPSSGWCRFADPQPTQANTIKLIFQGAGVFDTFTYRVEDRREFRAAAQPRWLDDLLRTESQAALLVTPSTAIPGYYQVTANGPSRSRPGGVPVHR